MARTSSAASGLRFCGMIELPVVKASLSAIKPNASLDHKHDLLGKARQMRAGERRRGEELDREIAVGDGIERVGRRAGRSRARRRWLAVDRKRGAGERGGAERALVEPPPAIGEPAAVAPDHLDIGQEMMAEASPAGRSADG